MLVEERTSNGGSMECSQLVPYGKSGAVNEFAFGTGSDFTDEIEIPGTFSVEGLRTYKRRKRLSSESDLQEDRKVSTVEADHLADKGIEYKTTDTKSSVRLAGGTGHDDPLITLHAQMDKDADMAVMMVQMAEQLSILRAKAPEHALMPSGPLMHSHRLQSKQQEATSVAQTRSFRNPTPPMSMKEPRCSNSYEHDFFSRSRAILDGSDIYTHGHWRNLVLEFLLQSLDVGEGGIQSCIRDALEFSPIGFTTMFKMQGAAEQTARTQESFHYQKDWQKNHFQTGKEIDGSLSAAKQDKGVTSNGSQNGPNYQADDHHITKLCQRVFLNVIVSEKFTLLCKLLCENFKGIKVDRLFDFSVINSRMKEGFYEQSPTQFSTDIQQVWRKFQRIGTEMVSLAKGLSDMSHTSYHEQMGRSVHGVCEDEIPEEINQIAPEQKNYFGFVTAKQLTTRESCRNTKPEQTEACGLYKVCICRYCGAKADGKDCLVCDSCEEMYHVSCIEPAVQEIPPRSWYCANCTASGIKSPHEDCVVCEKLNNVPTETHRGVDETVLKGEVMVNGLEERSDCSMKAENGLQLSSASRRLCCCKLCGSGEDDDYELRKCGHPLCPNKYYHVRCLTSQQLKSYGPCWYCPSCLCRACLTDKDDGKIVLCDGCDHAYHIYCMKPPRTSIPRGKWFCSSCDAGIQEVRRAKRAYEDFEKQQRKKQQRKNGPGGAKKAVGSVDMLLSAAEKLNSEEKLAVAEMKSERKQEILEKMIE
ncbi:hypothetical protein HHK36_008918 [Tetracentron sinense]|uniref:PHD-type domain-containing protein n=1 Tax=Tetracentron sinense TaxID=13715 RepID=A0A835DHY0_TETSI|nr:hypothetical protein HHK36_008918 [Tetracentron sinense]